MDIYLINKRSVKVLKENIKNQKENKQRMKTDAPQKKSKWLQKYIWEKIST